jgi:glycosyltransferase involved in cell wall biosynthesis
MKIVAIVQLFNELSSGFLEQFCKYNLEVFDEVIAYDDGSYDGTASYCRENGITVIESRVNNFCGEIVHKAALIKLADELEAEFIVSLDADEIIVNTRDELEVMCASLVENNVDGYESNFINLWRSWNYKRKDSLFDDFKPVKLWRHVSGEIPFSNVSDGLHQRLYPDYVQRVEFNSELIILHTGFSTQDRILDKFVRYRKYGQSGFELMRFVDESKLVLEKVEGKYLPANWPKDTSEPKKNSIRDYFNNLESARSRVFRPKVTIFSLIYKDVDWLKFMYGQFLKYTPLDGVEFYFIANDASEEVIQYMEDNYIPYYDFRNTPSHLKEHYINNVYRAYNFGVTKARGHYVLMLNSDMAFSEGWLNALLDKSDEGLCVASRLVEQGKLSTGEFGIEKNFGNSWESFDEVGFQEYARLIKDTRVEFGGLYMPLLVRKSDFERVGGYPEGNIVPGSDVFSPEIALPNTNVVSGDTAFIEKLESIGVKHVTAFDSIVYHFQEGEKRAIGGGSQDQNKYCEVAICNNRIQGINGEKVLWGYLADFPNTLPLDFDVVGGKTPDSFERHISQLELDPLLVLQNATFIPRFFSTRRTLMYLQDNLRAMGTPSAQQEINLSKAETLVTNTIDTAYSYPEFDFEICPVGVDASLFYPCDKKEMRMKHSIDLNKKVGIFVGALDEVKGWSEVLNIINQEDELSWIVVTKYDDHLSHPNIRFFSKQTQNSLVELLNCADFFVLGSPVETQCLAAIEAAFCNVPVVMKSVGIFSSFTNEELEVVGCIGDDLHKGVRDVLEKQGEFTPRDVMLSKGLSLDSTSKRWWNLFAREKMHALSLMYSGVKLQPEELSLFSQFMYKLEVFYRFRILKKCINRDTFYSIAEISVFIKNHLPKPFHTFTRIIWRLVRGKP